MVMSTGTYLLALLQLSRTSSYSLCQESAGKQDRTDAHERLAQQYLRERKPELAIPELEKVAALDPDNVEVRANLGVLLFLQKKYTDALPQLRKAVQLNPQLWKIQALLGLAETHSAAVADAQNDLETAFPQIQDKKLKIEVGLEQVGHYDGSSDLDDAARVIAQLRKDYPENAEILYAAYRTYADLSGESMLALSLAAPDSAQMHQLLAHEETREGNTNAAISQYKQAIAIDPSLPGVHFELAEILYTSEDPVIKKQAEQEYRTAVAKNPQDDKAICKLGEIAEQKGDVKQAYSDYSKAVQLQPSDADAKLGMAKGILEMDQPGKALPLLEAFVQLDPTSSNAHYRLATLYKKIGRAEDARREAELYKIQRNERETAPAL